MSLAAKGEWGPAVVYTYPGEDGLERTKYVAKFEVSGTLEPCDGCCCSSLIVVTSLVPSSNAPNAAWRETVALPVWMRGTESSSQTRLVAEVQLTTDSSVVWHSVHTEHAVPPSASWNCPAPHGTHAARLWFNRDAACTCPAGHCEHVRGACKLASSYAEMRSPGPQVV